jgi:glycosyltransferase involved in cell wall biosynthesis
MVEPLECLMVLAPDAPTPIRNVVRSRAAVVCWDLAHNPVGRAFVLVQLLERLYGKVDLIGPLFPRFGSSVWAPLAKNAGLSTIHAPVKGFKDLEKLGDRASKNKYDFVYICKPRWPSLYLGYRIANASGCEIALDIDDHELAFFPPSVEEQTVDANSVLDKIKRDAILPFAAEGTVLCESLIRHFPVRTVSNVALQKRFGGSIIRHARSSDDFDPSKLDRNLICRNLGYGSADKVISFVGTIRRHKGVISIAEAIAELADPRIKLCLVGPIDDSQISTELRDMLGGSVSIHEGVPFSSLPSIVLAADLVCLPQDPASRPAAYQIPAKLTDALAMGVPVILENVPPFSDLRGRAGIIIRDDQSLSAQIAEVLSDPPPRSAVRDTFLAEFSTTVSSEKLGEYLAQAPSMDSAAHKELSTALLGVQPHSSLPARISSPAVLRRPGRDIVFLWKQNDSGLFGRRADMITKYFPLVGGAGRVIHFDASIDLSALLRHEQARGSRTVSGGLVYDNVVSRWLGLRDELLIRRFTFIYDEHGRSFMGKPLPKRADLTGMFRDTFRSLGISNEALLWVCPVAFDFEQVVTAQRFGHIAADLIDDQRAFDAREEYKLRLQENYETILAAADTVFANCDGVARRFAPLLRSPAHIVSNAAERVNRDKMEAIDLFPGENVVRIGYVGNLRDRFDVDLVAKLAAAKPNYRVILVGPTGGNTEVEALMRLRNVTLTGPIPYDDANRIAAAFDIAIIPHLRNELTETMNPLKLYLFQALGLPVVAMGVDNLDHAMASVRIVNTHEHFLGTVEKMARRNIKRQVKISGGQSVFWDDQVAKIGRILNQRLGLSSGSHLAA